MKRGIAICICLLALVISACEKEKDLQFEQPGPNNPGNNGPGQSIVGEYNVVAVTGITLADLSVNESGIVTRAVTRSHYHGKDVQGTSVITNNKISYQNLSYSVDTLQYFEMYMNGTLLMEEELPFEVLASSQNTAASYVWNNTDSLTMSDLVGDPIVDNPGNPVSQSITKMGAKVSWAGDTLILNTYTPFNTSIPNPNGGAPGMMQGYARGIIKMKKK